MRVWRVLSLLATAAAVAVGTTGSGNPIGTAGSVGVAKAQGTAEGRLVTAAAPSAALGSDIDYTAYLPFGYGMSDQRYPTLYLLHGRGDSMAAWTQVKSELDTLIADGSIPPVVVVMPDAPWSSRGSWYVDSAYTGADDPGRPVETALTRDLVQFVDRTYRTVADRSARAVGGYSMGGYGALRYVLAEQDIFSAAIVLSPAVYVPLPPSDSSARDYGAFGQRKQLFDKKVYAALNYPSLLRQFDPSLPVHLFIAVGDDEYVNPKPADSTHDIDFESAILYNFAKRVPGITAEFRVRNGGHDWDVWRPAFVEGVQDVFRYVGAKPAVGLPGALLGTAGDDRAGGVATDPSGDVTVGLAAAGSIDGQPYAGGLDAVITRRSADGSTRWTRELGTSADERLYGVVGGPDAEIYAGGYSGGDFDGRHAGNASDDAVVMRVDADGTVAWRVQLGDRAAADRIYAVAPIATGGSYVAGYTKGSIDGSANAGDKDAFLAKLSPSGEVLWERQLGGPGEDKALAVTTDASGSVYVGGVASADIAGVPAAGGLDGWLAAYTPAGVRSWVQVLGTSADDQIAGLAPRPNGGVFAVGQSSGVMGDVSAGGVDTVTTAVTPAGAVSWTTQTGSNGDDRGADVVTEPDGSLLVAAYTDGGIGTASGGLDVAMLHLSASGTVLSTTQFGTPQNDGADAYGEENLYLTASADQAWLTGLTNGSTATSTNRGEGDVFVASVSPVDGTPQ